MAATQQSINIRDATPDDYPGLNALEILARATEPCWVYRFPFRDQYPEDHAKFNLEKYPEFANSHFRLVMAEMPDPNGPAGAMMPVGMALFDTEAFPPATEANKAAAARSSHKPQSRPNENRRDACLPRLAPFVAQHNRAKEFFFDQAFAKDGYLYLGILAVDPKYQGLGIGSKLVSWGQAQAKEAGVKMGLFATKYDGPRLYEQKNGFKSLGAIVCSIPNDQCPGERQVRMEALGWDPEW